MGVKQRAIDVAKAAGREVVPALEYEAQRRREAACGEAARIEHLLGSLPPRRVLARLFLRWQLRRARAQCAANKSNE